MTNGSDLRDIATRVDDAETVAAQKIASLDAEKLQIQALVDAGLAREATAFVRISELERLLRECQLGADYENAVPYTDVYKTGMDLNAVYKAAAAKYPGKLVNLIFPADIFVLPTTPLAVGGSQTYLPIPGSVATRGAGDGPEGTVFQFPESKMAAPLISNGTNQTSIVALLKSGALPGRSIIGVSYLFAPQKYEFNGVRIEYPDGGEFDFYQEGSRGSSGAPPGETFGVNIWHGKGYTAKIETVGSYLRQKGDLTKVGAAGLGINSPDGEFFLEDVIARNYQYSGVPLWDFEFEVTTKNLIIQNCKTGINHERIKKITHVNPTFKGIFGNHHTQFMNDLFDGLLTITDPTWDPSSYSSKLVVYGGSRGTDPVTKQPLPNLQKTKPVVTRAGVSIASECVFAAFAK